MPLDQASRSTRRGGPRVGVAVVRGRGEAALGRLQRGGFDADDAQRVIAMLEPLGVDLVELSGGSYESAAMSGRPAYARTLSREAYFLDLATELAATSPLPLMLTGGISQRDTAEKALASGVAVVGMATAMAVTPDLPNRWLADQDVTRRLRPITWSDKALASAAEMALRSSVCRMTRGPPGSTDSFGSRGHRIDRR